jgi:hypothetical protein
VSGGSTHCSLPVNSEADCIPSLILSWYSLKQAPLLNTLATLPLCCIKPSLSKATSYYFIPCTITVIHSYSQSNANWTSFKALHLFCTNFNGLFTLAYTWEELPEPEFWSRFIYLYKIDVHSYFANFCSTVSSTVPLSYGCFFNIGSFTFLEDGKSFLLCLYLHKFPTLIFVSFV